MKLSLEKKLLQATIALACLVPLSAGLAGMFLGSHFASSSVALDSHFRYLSGLLLGIGLGFMSTIPRIETHTERFRLLTFIVVIGGMGRLLGVFLSAVPGGGMIFALAMELIVTPALCLWQHSFARRYLAG